MKFLVILAFGIMIFIYAWCVLGHDTGTDVSDKHCECINDDCGCCTQLEVKGLIDGKLCSNFSYLPDQYGISVTITYKDIAIFNETVSAKNPPPICIIHVDKLQMEICMRFYNLDFKQKCFSGCAEFEIHFFKLFPLKIIKLGCFDCNKPSWNTGFQSLISYFTKSKQHEEEPQVILM